MNVKNESSVPDYIGAEILVLGCGNWLFGDDGFGCEAARTIIEEGNLPENVVVLDAGLSVRNILFDIVLSERRPRKIVIIDAVDAGREPGEVFSLEIDEIPAIKIDDFSMHQMPTVNLLKELKECCGVDVRILAVQVENIPESVSPGLSESLKKTLLVIRKKVLEIIGEKDA